MGCAPLLPIAEDHSNPNLGLLQLHGRRDTIRAEHNIHFNAQHVDVVLSPMTPNPASKLGTGKYWG